MMSENEIFSHHGICQRTEVKKEKSIKVESAMLYLFDKAK